MYEFCHNVTQVPQPSPNKNPGGDCFACTLTATLQHLFPENPPSFETVWDYFMVETTSGTKMLNNTWLGMQKAILTASRAGYKIEERMDIVLPSYDMRIGSQIFYPGPIHSDWLYRLEGWLRSGWIALQEIDFAGRGPVLPDGRRNANDHFVVVDGVRYGWVPHPTMEGAKTMEYEVHVVCSARGAYWVTLEDWIRKYGAAGWILVRKTVW